MAFVDEYAARTGYSKAQAEQVRAVAVERFRRRVGTLPAPVLRRLDNALSLHLAP